MRLVRGKKKVRETFDKYFPEELRDWLLEETRLNKQEPLSEQQRCVQTTDMQQNSELIAA